MLITNAYLQGEKWLALRWHTKELVNGRWDLDIEVWDVKGRLIANGSALFLLVDISRMAAHGMNKQQQSKKAKM